MTDEELIAQWRIRGYEYSERHLEVAAALARAVDERDAMRKRVAGLKDRIGILHEHMAADGAEAIRLDEELVALRQRVAELARVLSNCWLGVSVEDQETADERIPWLLQTPAAVRFVRAEPLLGPIVFDPQVLERRTKILTGAPAPRIGWVIVGGESGPKARPCDVEWIRSIVQQCKAAAVPVFVKQDSGPRPGMRGRIPEDLWIREFPGEEEGAA